MIKITPLVIGIIVILSAIVGGIISHLIFKYRENKNSDNNHFHVDSNTGIVSDITSFKY